jgi:ADP-ribose pyrophosphatase YjhB (NUDIX family)
MTPADLFRFCPQCGVARPAGDAGRVPLSCSACGLVLYFNPTVSAAAWIFDADGRVLLLKRAHEPAKGKFAIPGGFVDFGETAEEALHREVREEVGIEIDTIAFLASLPNRYEYREVSYPVLDLVFTARAIDPALARPLDGAAGIEWRRPGDIDPEELAFPSMRETVGLAAGHAER